MIGNRRCSRPLALTDQMQKSVILNTPTTSTAHTAMAAGWFAGLVNVAVGHPFDTGKVRAQARMAEADGGLRPSQTSSKTGGNKRPSAGGAAAGEGTAGNKASCWIRYGAQIYKAEGLAGLYRGLGFCIFRAIPVPVAICTLPAYDMCFNFLQG
eukprot:g12640.t1